MLHEQKERSAGRPRLGSVVRPALTLLEMLIVLTILTATAIIVVPMLSVRIESPQGKPLSADEIVTQSTLTVVRDAIVGEDGVIENLAHAPDAIPRKLSELLSDKPPEHIERSAPS